MTSKCEITRNQIPEDCIFNDCIWCETNKNFFGYEVVGNQIAIPKGMSISEFQDTYWQNRCTHPLRGNVYPYLWR